MNYSFYAGSFENLTGMASTIGSSDGGDRNSSGLYDPIYNAIMPVPSHGSVFNIDHYANIESQSQNGSDVTSTRHDDSEIEHSILPNNTARVQESLIQKSIGADVNDFLDSTKVSKIYK